MKDKILVGFAVGGVVLAALGGQSHSLLLMSAGFLLISAYSFLWLAWTE